jgi:ribosomal-protein-alanine acetyltransferase
VLSFYNLNRQSQAEITSFYQLYLSCFNGDPTRKWSSKGFAEILKLEGVGAHLCCRDDDLCGFIIWRVTCDESELLNIGVKANDRKKGIGLNLLDGMVLQMEKQGVKKVFLEVRKNNSGARELYTSYGFEVSGTRKKYYSHQDGKREDAIVMLKTL